MNLIAHDQRGDACSHRYSIQTEDGKVLLLFDIPDGVPITPTDVAIGLEIVANDTLFGFAAALGPTGTP